MRRLLTGLLGVTLLVSACGDDDGDDGSAVTSIPERSTTTSTTTTAPAVPPPDVIPEDVSLITEEYVEQVLNALYEVSLEAVELARAEGLVDQPSIERLESISSETYSVNAINSLLNLSSTGFAGLRDELSPVRSDVQDVLEASRSCVFVEVSFDTSGLTDTPPPAAAAVRTFARLLAASETGRDTSLNPSAWVLDSLPVTEDGSVPDEGCGGNES